MILITSKQFIKIEKIDNIIKKRLLGKTFTIYIYDEKRLDYPFTGDSEFSIRSNKSCDAVCCIS